jgi:hypothetical protein
MKKNLSHVKRSRSSRHRARLKAKHRRARKRNTGGERKYYR